MLNESTDGANSPPSPATTTDPVGSPSASGYEPGGGGPIPSTIPTALLLGALRLADVHTAKMIRDGVIDQNSALRALCEIEAALMPIHPTLFSAFPELTAQAIWDVDH